MDTQLAFSAFGQHADLVSQKTDLIVKLFADLEDFQKRVDRTEVEIGEALLEIKEALTDFQYESWTRQYFKWGMTKRRQLERVARVFHGEPEEVVRNFTKTAIAAAASPSYPKEARDQAKTAAKSGRVTLKDVETFKKVALAQEPQTVLPLPMPLPMPSKAVLEAKNLSIIVEENSGLRDRVSALEYWGADAYELLQSFAAETLTKHQNKLRTGLLKEAEALHLNYIRFVELTEEGAIAV